MSDLSDTFVRALPDLSVLVRRDGRVISHLGGRDLGISTPRGALIGKTLADLWPGGGAEELNRMLRTSLKARKPIAGCLVLGDRRVEARVSPQGVDRCFVTIRQTSMIESDVDPLVVDARAPDPNDLEGFARRLRATIESARMRETRVGLLVVSFGALPSLEQAHGVASSSVVVTGAAERLNLYCSSQSVEGAGSLRASRIAGEQLAVLMDRITDTAAVQRLAFDIRRLLSKAITLEGSRYKLFPSVGCAIFPEDGLEPDILLERARASASELETAPAKSVRTARRVGRSPAGEQNDLASELRCAIEAGQLRVSYAALVELEGRRASQLVATPRWTHSICGEMKLQAYSDLLDSLGLRSRLDRWLLERVCADMSQGTACVHLSAGRAWLSEASVVGAIQAVAKSAEVSLSQLALNIDLQSVAASSPSLDNIRRLRELGIRIILGNFGNVGVSLSRLGSLPLDGVKLSRSVTVHCDRNAAARATCQAAGATARAFGLDCIAEGADRQAQLETILATCTHASGAALAPVTDASPMPY
ncbi:MAG: EAL domain-containing protein [Proteobacteria bacterium]|nr:EAL domain-containing protein [Pseudomonadota bacterium]